MSKSSWSAKIEKLYVSDNWQLKLSIIVGCCPKAQAWLCRRKLLRQILANIVELFLPRNLISTINPILFLLCKSLSILLFLVTCANTALLFSIVAMRRETLIVAWITCTTALWHEEFGSAGWPRIATASGALTARFKHRIRFLSTALILKFLLGVRMCTFLTWLHYFLLFWGQM